MNKDLLLKKIATMLEEFERTRAWGIIEIELRDGAGTLARKTVTERLDGDQHRERTRVEARNKY